MKAEEIRQRAYSMPIESPSYPPGPYRFVNREFFIVTYRTDYDALRRLVPEPLEITDPIVKYEFIRMPDSTGFGDYTESGQVIPVHYRDKDQTVQAGGFVLSMFLDDDPPIAGGREIWGFPKKMANPKLSVAGETLVGTLDFGPVRVASATMGYKYSTIDHDAALRGLQAPGFLLKIIPHVDGTPRICELVRYYLKDITVKGAWSGPAALDLHAHALAPIANLPIREILGGSHIIADLTLGLGEVVHDYRA